MFSLDGYTNSKAINLNHYAASFRAFELSMLESNKLKTAPDIIVIPVIIVLPEVYNTRRTAQCTSGDHPTRFNAARTPPPRTIQQTYSVPYRTLFSRTFWLRALATEKMVMSSCVGPTPPEVITTSNSCTCLRTCRHEKRVHREKRERTDVVAVVFR